MSRVATAGVAGLLDAAAAERPEHLALVHGDERVSYEALHARVEDTAAALAAVGVGPGDPVALLLPNGPDWVVSFLAVARAGGVAVPLNPRSKAPELEHCFRDAGVRALVDPGGVRRMSGVPAAAGHDPSGDAAVFLYSSGSTGRPKRVPRTHGDLTAEATGVAEGLAVDPADRVFCAIPLFHTYGMGCGLLASVAGGATLVLLPDGQPFVLRREWALRTMQRERVTVVPAVPFTLRLLAETPAMPVDLSSVRLCLSAATPLPRSTFDAFDAAFGVPVRQLYGCTETGALTANLDDDPAATAASVGTPLPGVEVSIVDPGGAPLEAGRIGDVLVRAPGMAAGYAGRPELNRVAFRDGWFGSGDRGRLDEDGRLFLTGRAKLLIDVQGSDKVDPIEVEDVLAVHPRVREVVVVGAETAVAGEQLVRAVVVADAPCAERELVRYCRERLAEYKVPRDVVFVDELPRGADGKLLRKYLVS